MANTNGKATTQFEILDWQSRLRNAVLESITADDIRDVLGAIVTKAKKGDLQAARLVLSYAVGNPATSERLGNTAEPAPTRAVPGGARKLDIMARRYLNGQDLHSPHDQRSHGDED